MKWIQMPIENSQSKISNSSMTNTWQNVNSRPKSLQNLTARMGISKGFVYELIFKKYKVKFSKNMWGFPKWELYSDWLQVSSMNTHYAAIKHVGSNLLSAMIPKLTQDANNILYLTLQKKDKELHISRIMYNLFISFLFFLDQWKSLLGVLSYQNICITSINNQKRIWFITCIQEKYTFMCKNRNCK